MSGEDTAAQAPFGHDVVDAAFIAVGGEGQHEDGEQHRRVAEGGTYDLARIGIACEAEGDQADHAGPGEADERPPVEHAQKDAEYVHAHGRDAEGRQKSRAEREKEEDDDVQDMPAVRG